MTSIGCRCGYDIKFSKIKLYRIENYIIFMSFLKKTTPQLDAIIKQEIFIRLGFKVALYLMHIS